MFFFAGKATEGGDTLSPSLNLFCQTLVDDIIENVFLIKKHDEASEDFKNKV